jgi:hypothetical protein
MKSYSLLGVIVSVFIMISLPSQAFAQDPGIPDTVRLENLITDVSGPPYQGTAVLPIRVFNDEYLSLLCIPLKWTGPLLGDSGRFAGEREPYISQTINMYSKSCPIGFSTVGGEPFCPPGDDTLVYLYFSVEDTGFVCLDTYVGGPAEFYLHFYDSLLNKIIPYINAPRLYHILPYLPGDVDNDGQINIEDVVFLINYLFREGSPPDFLELGDVNGDCVVDIGDVVYLINYLFRDGPLPENGCAW